MLISDDGVFIIDVIWEWEWFVRDWEIIFFCYNKSFEGVLVVFIGKREEKKFDVDVRKDVGKGVDGFMFVLNFVNWYVNVEEKWFWKEYLGIDVVEELGINFFQFYIMDFKKKDVRNFKLDMKFGQCFLYYLYYRLFNVKFKFDGFLIIIVLSVLQMFFNMFNVKEFFEDGVYVFFEVKVKGMVKKVDIVFVQWKMGRE